MVADVWNRLRTAAPRGATALIADSALGTLFLALYLAERLVVAPLPSASLPAALACGLGIAAGLALRRRTPLPAFVLGATALAACGAQELESLSGQRPSFGGRKRCGAEWLVRAAWDHVS